MNGRKHSQGGIDIGPSDKTGIEVEGGEVVELMEMNLKFILHNLFLTVLVLLN